MARPPARSGVDGMTFDFAAWSNEKAPCDGCGKGTKNMDLRGVYIPCAVIGRLCGDCLQFHSGDRICLSRKGLEGLERALMENLKSCGRLKT